MNASALDQIIEAVLYEGYILYPYRASSRKNYRERFTFGRVYPEAYSKAQNGAEPAVLQTECLVVSNSEEPPLLNLTLGFLQPVAREVRPCDDQRPAPQAARPALVEPQLRPHEGASQTWYEAVERRVAAPPLRVESLPGDWRSVPFEFPETRSEESLIEEEMQTGLVVRRQASIRGELLVTACRLGRRIFRVTVQVLNHTDVKQSELNDSDAILLRTLASTHFILNVQGGEFVSLTDPGSQYKDAADSCHNSGMWPVLVGDPAKDERDTVLSSPIILYDYPQIARESAGPLSDGTEIEEILTLRILSMTDNEKLEMRKVDEHARRMLERTEALSSEGIMRMHGAMRPAAQSTKGAEADSRESDSVEFDDFFGAATPLNGVSVRGVYLQPGDRVRVWPRARADVMDLAVEGQTAIIEAVEQDVERKIHLAVVFENDPGKDLGLSRQPGHRFFYGVEEVEPVRTKAP